MTIKDLKLVNFRCFRELAITFHENMTVLVAPNGGGKTAILDAVAFLLSTFVGQFKGVRTLPQNAEDVRVIRKDDGSRIPVYPSAIEGSFGLPGNSSEAACVRVLEQGDGKRQRLGNDLRLHARRLRGLIHSECPGWDVVLPVVAYYRSTRTVPPKELKVDIDLGSAALMRHEGYQGCLRGNANINLFRTWYGKAAIAELSVQQKLGKEPVGPSNQKLAERARAVRETVNAVLSGVSDDRHRYWLDLFLWMDSQVGVLDTEQNVELGLHQLSDGVACMLGMAGDLAARCAVLNPHFGPDAPGKTPGIVLIDEVDLHLHPSWQQRVLDDLSRAFPLVQFIISTHSPQVLTTLKSENIRLIRADGAVSPRHTPYAKTSADALEAIMGVPAAPPSIDLTGKFDEYKALVGSRKHDTQRARELRKELEEEWGQDDGSLQCLDIIIRKNEILTKRQEG